MEEINDITGAPEENECGIGKEREIRAKNGDEGNESEGDVDDERVGPGTVRKQGEGKEGERRKRNEQNEVAGMG
jgi:hypothetical protein